MELAEVKTYLRVDGTDEDVLISSLQLAAEIFIVNVGVDKDYTNDLYKLAIKLLVLHWYDSREVVGKADKLAFSLETIIFSIKYNQPAPVVSIVPLDAAIGVLPTASVVLTFSTGIKPVTIVGANVYLTKSDVALVASTLSIDATGKIVTLDPVDSLISGSYIVSANNLTSIAGLSVIDITSTFTV